ncbi:MULTISPECIES: aldose 1-epimerase family protein [Vagococcus]|uniref:LacX protein, plasmid n=1 Tax=Vagococcus fluvialis bH819 TaxID=1255619 RepID=A0A1X6WN84_9ENTE|nr:MULTISPECIES: aldose 1-epimerase family protein [Vagococcus]SLM85729.1 LacX protein, plasmid [Vagococcus fluvialis bH819]HCM90151.1 aldose 1-epimerase family protein [Vagococcus sp.]
MSVILENSTCQVKINEKGAELCSFILKEANLEYIWQADNKYWGRYAPVLFPFVGKLKENKYTYKGQTYQMSQHGFARDMNFKIEETTMNSASFLLSSDADTLINYPFDFDFRIIYQLEANDLKITYQVTTRSEEMYFGVGGHPAFNIPLTDNTDFNDYYLHFAPSKSRFTLPLDGAYINLAEKTLAQTNTSIQIERSIFEKDALVLETKGENAFSILSDVTEHGVTISYKELPYVGIWSPYPKEAPFVCIEPWAGIADTIESTGKIEEKVGMNLIHKDDLFEKSFIISVK